MVKRILPEPVNQDPPSRQRFVSIPTEYAPPAVTHRQTTPGTVIGQARKRLEHGGERPLRIKPRSGRIIIDAFAAASHLAKEEPLVKPVVDIITLRPSPALPCKLKRRRSAGQIVLLQ